MFWKAFPLLALGYTALAAEPGYQLFVEDIKNCDDDRSYFDMSSLKLSRYNRTTSVMQGYITLNRDLPQDSTVTVTCQKLSSTKHWTSIPLSLNGVKLCDFVERDKAIAGNILGATSLPKHCPYLKGNYSMINAAFKPDLIPIIPRGCYRIEGRFKSDSRELSCVFTIFKLGGPKDKAFPRCI